MSLSKSNIFVASVHNDIVYIGMMALDGMMVKYNKWNE